MINSNMKNTTVHNNDFLTSYKNIINILYTQTSSTTLEKFNETNLSKSWERGEGTHKHPLWGQRLLFYS